MTTGTVQFMSPAWGDYETMLLTFCFGHHVSDLDPQDDVVYFLVLLPRDPRDDIVDFFYLKDDVSLLHIIAPWIIAAL
jgi:hypothetical protein